MRKTKIRKIILSAVSSLLSMSLLFCQTVFASTQNELEQKQQELEQRNEEIDGLISSLSGDIAENKELQELYSEKLENAEASLSIYSDMIYDMNVLISQKQAEIDDLGTQISEKETEIEEKQQEVACLQQENDENLTRFGEIVRALYVSNGIDYISVLMDSADFYDLLVRAKMLFNIARDCNEFMDSLLQDISDTNEKAAQLQSDKEQLELDRTALVESKEELQSEKALLDAKKQEAQTLSDEYNADYSYYSQALSNLQNSIDSLHQEQLENEEELARIEEEIQELIRKAQQSSTQQYDDGEWLWPVGTQFSYITTDFGDDYLNGQWRWHKGIDIGDGGIFWTDIYASKSGTVIKAFNDDVDGVSYGKYIIIDHGDGYSTLYGHCAALYVYEGQQVNQGDVIGAVGSTGWSTGPHLHFEVRIDGVANDPFMYVNRPW